MIEIVSRVVRHTDSLHNATRGAIRLSGERHDLFEFELAKAKVERSQRAFSGIPASPELGSESPADFSARSEMGLEADWRQSDEACERRDIYNLDRPETPPMLFDMAPNALGHLVTLVRAESSREVPHRPRVGVELGEWFQVCVPPFPKPQSLGLKFHWILTA
jgi:hypothetical protein